MNARSLLPALCLSAATVLAACGGSDSSSASETTVAGAAVADTVVTDTAVPDTAVADTGAADTAGPTPGGSGPTAEQTEALRACLEENGVELPEGGLGGLAGGAPGAGGTPPSLPEGIDPAALQQAFTACGDLFPAGGLGGAGGAGGAGGPDVSALITCLRDNGVAIPDGGGLTEIPLTDPALADAQQTCAPLAGGFGGAAPTTTAA